MLLYSDTASEWSDASSAVARAQRVRPKGRRVKKRRGVRATVEAAAERSRSHFVDSVCEELCPRFRRLEVQASRVDAIQEALLHLPAHKELRKKCAALEREMARKTRQLRSIAGEETGERRLASDGRAYTRAEFAAYYGKMHWDAAANATECFGDVGEPMSLRVREKRSAPKGRWCSLAAAQVPVAARVCQPCAANERVVARAPDLFDCRGPSESGSEAGESVVSSSSSRSRSSQRAERVAAAAEDETASLASEGAESEAAESLAGSEASFVSGSAVSGAGSELGAEAESEADEVSEAEEASEADEVSEAEEASEEGEEEEEVEEISLGGKAYYASGVTADSRTSTGFTRDSNGPIYAIQADDDVGDQVGEIVSGKPRLYKTRRVVAAAR